MSTEELIREIVSKQCPFHGQHPTVKIHKIGQMKISACCEEFREHIGHILKIELQKSSAGTGSTENI